MPADSNKPGSLKTKYQSTEKTIKAINHRKIGYPTSVAGTLYVKYTDTGVDVKKAPAEGYKPLLDLAQLGISPDTLSSLTIINVGNPFTIQSGRLDVKRFEVDVIRLLSQFLGISGSGTGYVTAGGTEGNFVCLWWLRKCLINKHKTTIKSYEEILISQKNEVYEILAQLKTPTLIASDQTHYSFDKIADQLNLHYLKIKSSPNGAIDLVEFEYAVKRFAASYPYGSLIINANIGTTVSGAIDDVVSMKAILSKHLPSDRYYIHADAALLGLTLPVLKPFGDVKNYFSAIGVSTMAISGHKFLGLPYACGIALTTTDIIDYAFSGNYQNIEYLNHNEDFPFSGSRSGLNVLVLYKALHSVGIPHKLTKLQKIIQQCFNNLQYFKKRLMEIFPENQIYHNPYQFNLIFPKVSQFLIRKYQLMPVGNTHVAACVLLNITEELVNNFLDDCIREVTLIRGRTLKNSLNPMLTIQLLTEANKQECSSFITANLNFTTSIVESICQQAADEGLSLLFRLNENLIGCFIIENLSAPFKLSINNPITNHPNFALLIDEENIAYVYFAIFDNEKVPANLIEQFTIVITNFLNQSHILKFIIKKSDVFFSAIMEKSSSSVSLVDDYCLITSANDNSKFFKENVMPSEINPKPQLTEVHKALDKKGIFQKNTKYTFEQLNESHIEQVTRLIKETIPEYDPLAKYMRLTPKDYESLAPQLAAHAAKQGLSVVGLDGNNNVVACLISEDINSPFIPEREISPKLHPIFAMLETVSEPFLKGKTFERGHLSHSYLTLVDKRHQGTGLSTRINAEGLKHVQSKHYDFVYTGGFTSSKNENTMKYLLSKLINQFNPRDFEMDGVKPFANFDNFITSYLVLLNPGAKLTYTKEGEKIEEDVIPTSSMRAKL